MVENLAARVRQLASQTKRFERGPRSRVLTMNGQLATTER
jgi:hypothetical protein